MAEISIGGAVSEGFSLIGKRPLVVLAWGLVFVLLMGAMFALIGPAYLAVFAGLRGQAAGAAPVVPNMQGVMRVQALSYLYDIVMAFTEAVLYCAVFRAVIHPQRAGWAYLRVGAPELFLFILIIGFFFAFIIGAVVAAIPIGLVVVGLAAAHAGAAAVIVGVLGGVAALVVLVYLLLRFALIGPMMVDDGQFHLTEAWALTRGKAMSLFAVALLVGLILLAAETVVGLVLLGVGFGMMGAMAGGLQNLQTFFQQPPQALIGKLAPLLAIAAVIWVPLMGSAFAIMSAPWARAYLDLRPPRDIAETFV